MVYDDGAGDDWWFIFINNNYGDYNNDDYRSKTKAERLSWIQKTFNNDMGMILLSKYRSVSYILSSVTY